LNGIEIQPKIAGTDIFVDNLKPIIYSIVNLPKKFFHVGSKSSIVIEVEQKMIKVAEELEENIEKLSVARNINCLVDG
jgi:hypothetical protein